MSGNGSSTTILIASTNEWLPRGSKGGTTVAEDGKHQQKRIEKK